MEVYGKSTYLVYHCDRHSGIILHCVTLVKVDCFKFTILSWIIMRKTLFISTNFNDLTIFFC